MREGLANRCRNSIFGPLKYSISHGTSFQFGRRPPSTWCSGRCPHRGPASPSCRVRRPRPRPASPPADCRDAGIKGNEQRKDRNKGTVHLIALRNHFQPLSTTKHTMAHNEMEHSPVCIGCLLLSSWWDRYTECIPNIRKGRTKPSKFWKRKWDRSHLRSTSAKKEQNGI